MVARPGGAHLVTDMEAIESIKSGKHFVPHEKGNILFRKYGHHWGLKPHMSYRQSMLFMAYLKTMDEKMYRNLLIKIQDGECFADAFNETFNLSLNDIWDKFLKEIKSKSNNNMYQTGIPLRSMLAGDAERYAVMTIVVIT